jgi:O-acetyl-ADP-ribose deacetylase (regulator of RNase III)
MAIKTVQKFLEENPLPEKVIFCIFGKDNLEIYNGLIGE